MDIKDIYENETEVLGRAFTDLQADTQTKVPELGHPEVLDDDLLREWLALHYVWALHFKADRTPIMGEIGGIVPIHPEDGGRILAVADASILKVMYGADMIKEAEKTGNKTIISELEDNLERAVEYRGNVTVVNGNSNAAHYDFTSRAAGDDPMDMFTANLYLLLSADGLSVLSNKCLDSEQYIFNVPQNEKIFGEFPLSMDEAGFEQRIEALNASKDDIIPAGFIAGFHIIYRGSRILIQPVIGEKESDRYSDYLKSRGLRPAASDIHLIGNSDPSGDFGVMEQILLE